ncbi:WD40 repeat domain-containing protein [[Phormidium ambiguum] IAM M-71]
MFTLSGHTDWVNSVTFCPQGNRIVTGSNDMTVKIWQYI